MKPNTIQFPTPGPPPERPRLPRRPDTDRLRFTYPSVPSLSYWTVDAVKSALAQHDWGMFWYSGLLEDQVERNPRIAAALNTRTLGVLGLPFSIDPGKGRSRKKAVKDLKEQWPAIAPQEVLAEMLRNLVMLGVAVAEVVWTTESGQWIPTLHPVHPVFVRWDRSIERLTVLAWGDLVPVTPGDGRWVVLTRARRWGWLRGTIRCLALQDAIRSYAVRDWARYSEKHGLPILKVTVPAEADEELDDMVANSLSELGNESTLTMPQNADGQGFDAEFIEPKDRSWESFQGLIQQCDGDVSIAILGQNLTTEVSGGSLAAARVHNQVRQDYLEADVSVLQQSIRQQLIEPWALYNYGDRACAPKLLWNPTPPDDMSVVTKTQTSALLNLKTMRDLGIAIDEKAYLERVGITAKAVEAPKPVETEKDDSEDSRDTEDAQDDSEDPAERQDD